MGTKYNGFLKKSSVPSSDINLEEFDTFWRVHVELVNGSGEFYSGLANDSLVFSFIFELRPDLESL